MCLKCVVCLMGFGILAVTEVRSTVVSSCWEAGLETDMDLVQSEVSTSQEMSYVCRQFSSEITRKFEVDEVPNIIE